MNHPSAEPGLRFHCIFHCRFLSFPLPGSLQALPGPGKSPWGCRGLDQLSPLGSGFIQSRKWGRNREWVPFWASEVLRSEELGRSLFLLGTHRFPVLIMVLLATPPLSSLLQSQSGFYSGLPGFQPFPGNKAPVQAPRVPECSFAT